MASDDLTFQQFLTVGLNVFMSLISSDVSFGFDFQKINEKPQVIADYECGKAIPNNQVMGKIERAIGECDSLSQIPLTLLIINPYVLSCFRVV